MQRPFDSKRALRARSWLETQPRVESAPRDERPPKIGLHGAEDDQGRRLQRSEGLTRVLPRWTDAYGLEPGLDGTNVLVGPGIVQANEIASSDVEIKTQHSHATGSRLVGVCQKHLFEHDELDLLDHLNAKTPLDEVVCRQVGQPCGKPKPKKKPKKKAAKAKSS